MAAWVLFLCIVLSEFISISLSQWDGTEWATTAGDGTRIVRIQWVFVRLFSSRNPKLQLCPEHICMTIDHKVCCGKSAPGRPKDVPRWVTVPRDTTEIMGSALFEAGFPNYNYQDEQSRPSCSQTFRWSETHDKLEVTDEIALAIFPTGYIIEQTFTWERDCPNAQDNAFSKNPYYDRVRLKEQHQYSKPEIPPGAYLDESNVDIDSSVTFPTIGTLFPSAEEASAFNTNLKTAIFTGGDDTGYGYNAAPSMQLYPPASKRRTPVEFRA
ncbi:hypothetical protein MMC22_010378 [Lobaria immixta]|nr:hypothetical protein [Lobaria immixta]